MRRRLYSVLLLPFMLSLLGIGGGGQPPAAVPVNRVIELEMPAHRRVPPAVTPKATLTPVPKLKGSGAILEGRVLDSKTRKPIVGAEVSVPELDRRTVTDGTGRFQLGNIKVRTQSYEVLVTCPGYVSFFADAVFEKGKKLNCEYRLKPVGW
mgnify:FL=1